MLQELKDTTEDVTEMQHLFTFPLQTSGVRELLDGWVPAYVAVLASVHCTSICALYWHPMQKIK